MRLLLSLFLTPPPLWIPPESTVLYQFDDPAGHTEEDFFSLAGE